MRQFIVMAAAALTLLWAAALTNAQPPERDRPGGPNPERRARLLEEFDADGDGQLSEQERATARETMRERRRERAEGRPDARRGPAGDAARDGDRPARVRERDRDRLGPPEGRPGRRFGGPPADRPGRRFGGPPADRPGRGFGGPPADRPGRGFGGPPADRDRPVGPPATADTRRGFIDPRALFDQFDENNDDQLSREEFLSLSIEVAKLRSERFAQFGPPGPRGRFLGGGEFGRRADGPPRDGRRFDRDRPDRPGREGREGRPPRRDRPQLEQSANTAEEPAQEEAI